MTGVEQGVQVLCERYGYGRIMQIASTLWAQKDPIGALSIGPAYGMLKKFRCDNCGELCWLDRKRGVVGGWSSLCCHTTYRRIKK